MSRKWIITLSIIGGVVLFFVFLAWSTPGPLRSEGDIHTLVIGPLTVPVAAPEPAAESPDQYLGVPGPGPTFDTTDLGPNLSLHVGTPDFAALDIERIVRPDRILRAVYLGDDKDGVPVYIYAEGSNNPFNLLGQIILDQGSIGRLGSTYHCCIPGPLPDDAFGLSVQETYALENGETALTAEWHGLPDTVSVVAVVIDGEAIGWQTPTSGTAAIRVKLPTDTFNWETRTVETDTGPRETIDLISTITLIAYDTEGDELARA